MQPADARPERSTSGRRFGALLLLVALCAVCAACAGGPPSKPLPAAVDATYFPLAVGRWWEFDTFFPGFPDRPQRFRFLMQEGDASGYPVVSRAVSAESDLPEEVYRLRIDAGSAQMVKGAEPMTLLRFGATVGSTWPYHPTKTQYLAQLKSIRYERVMGAWRPIAEVTYHAGGPDTPATKVYWFSPSIGWVRIVQHRLGGSAVEAILVDAHPVPAKK